MLTFKEFGDRAVPLRTPDGPLLLWATGLGGETGEVVEELLNALALAVSSGRVQDFAKKANNYEGSQDVHGREWPTQKLDEEMLKEAGDVLFYLNQLLIKRGLTLEQAAETLIEKLGELR